MVEYYVHMNNIKTMKKSSRKQVRRKRADVVGLGAAAVRLFLNIRFGVVSGKCTGVYV